MSKLIVLIVGIVWASLLLISWGGADETGMQKADSDQVQRTAF